MPPTNWKKMKRMPTASVIRWLDFRVFKPTERATSQIVAAQDLGQALDMSKRPPMLFHDFDSITRKSELNGRKHCQLSTEKPTPLRIERVFQENEYVRRIRLELPDIDEYMHADQISFNLDLRIPQPKSIPDFLQKIRDSKSTNPKKMIKQDHLPPSQQEPMDELLEWHKVWPVNDYGVRGCVDCLVATHSLFDENDSVSLQQSLSAEQLNSLRLDEQSVTRMTYLDSLRTDDRVFVRGPFANHENPMMQYPFGLDGEKRTRIGVVSSGLGLAKVMSMLKNMCFEMQRANALKRFLKKKPVNSPEIDVDGPDFQSFECVRLVNGFYLEPKNQICRSDLLSLDLLMNEGQTHYGRKGRRPSSFEEDRFHRVDLLLPYPSLNEGGFEVNEPTDFFRYSDTSMRNRFWYDIQELHNPNMLSLSLPKPSDQTMIIISTERDTETEQCTNSLLKLGYTRDMICVY